MFVRTFLLTLITTFFTFTFSGMDETILAVNALLMQFFMLFSYFLNGFAYAGEAFIGRYAGAKKTYLLKAMIKRVLFWGVCVSMTVVILYAIFTEQILQI